MIADDSEQFQIVLRAGDLAVTLIMNFVGLSDSNGLAKHQGSVTPRPHWFSCSVSKTEEVIGGVFYPYGEDDCGAGCGSTVW